MDIHDFFKKSISLQDIDDILSYIYNLSIYLYIDK